MSKSLNIKRGDTALVISGKEKGKKAKVLQVIPKKHQVIMEGTNMVMKHKKPRRAGEQGGIISQEGAFEISNVMVVCPSCSKPTRVGHKIDEDGKKTRVCKKCGAGL